MQESRMFKILYYLLDKGQTTAAELAEKFEVSIRTIYRDIDVISSAGIPIYTSIGRNGGIQLESSFVLKGSLLSQQEQCDILMALRTMEAAGNYQDGETISKLNALFQTQVPQWIDIDFSQWGEYNNMNEKFELLKTAVLERIQITFEYAGSKGEMMQRRVNPVKLLYKSSAWYLQAYCMVRKDFRTFKVNRITGLTLTNETFGTLKAPLIKKIPENNYISVVLHFSEKIAYRVYDEFNIDFITKQSDGSIIVSVEMPDEEWIIRYLLSFGRYVSVLSPVKLRTDFLEEAKAAYETNLC